jgi:hypothetical protein
MPHHQLILDLCKSGFDGYIFLGLKAEQVAGKIWQRFIVKNALDQRINVLAPGGATIPNSAA